MSKTTNWTIDLSNPTDTLLREIADPAMKQRDIALTYLLARASTEATDWPRVNRAIMDRWSQSGLVRVKKIAQRLMQDMTEVVSHV